MATRKGADYAWWRPPAGWFAANGITFVSRYLSWLPDSPGAPGGIAGRPANGKVLTPAEFRGLQGAGIDVCFNWEYDAQDQKRGYNGGIADASEAVRQIYKLGASDPYNVYFSADWDASWSDYTSYIRPYMSACANVLGGLQHVGIYGSYNVVRWAMGDGVGFGWQTFAWSGGLWYPGAQVRQTNIYPQFDLDFAFTADFGQYGYRTTPPAQPAVAPVPVPHFYDDTQTGND